MLVRLCSRPSTVGVTAIYSVLRAERCECRIISSTGFRRSDNARDTGGQLTMGMGIMGEVRLVRNMLRWASLIPVVIYRFGTFRRRLELMIWLSCAPMV